VPGTFDRTVLFVEFAFDELAVVMRAPILDGEDLATAIDDADLEIVVLHEALFPGGKLVEWADVDQRTHVIPIPEVGILPTGLMSTFSRMERRPLVGVTTSEVRRAERTRPLPEGEPPQHEMALGMPYVRALARAGAVPIVLPPLSVDIVPSLLRSLSAVCLSGGPDLDPSAYGASPSPELGPIEPHLDQFELEVARVADAAGLPILGICRGAQALNVARGGSLHQHLPAITDNTVNHRQTAPGWEETHFVRVEEDSRLSSVLALDELRVNSFHHQAVDRLGSDLVAVAWAPDGTVEGIEDPGERFVLGVQWHAETLDRGPVHPRLFEALVAAASGARLDIAA
jgi:putative glutamine amidotransferase